MEPLKSSLSKLRHRDENCPVHGPYQSLGVEGMEESWSPCLVCHQEEQDAQRRRELASREQELKQAKFNSSGIPPRFKDASLANYHTATSAQKQALDICLGYCADFQNVMREGRCLVFLGNVGTGKTHLAVGIMREAIAQGWTAKMATIGDYFRECKAAWGKKAELSEMEVLESYLSPDLLVLDEVGVQFGSQTELNLIFNLINKRYNHNKPNLAIANLEKDQLEEFLGPATYDRLRGGLLVTFDWESFRGRSAA